MTGKLESFSGPSKPPAWVDKLYQSKLEQGFTVRAVAIRPDQPMHRIPQMYDYGVYDYDSEVLPYATAEDARYAEVFQRLVGELIQQHGLDNVDPVPLPSSIGLINSAYPHRVHRVIMARPNNLEQAKAA